MDSIASNILAISNKNTIFFTKHLEKDTDIKNATISHTKRPLAAFMCIHVWLHEFVYRGQTRPYECSALSCVLIMTAHDIRNRQVLDV